MEEAHGGQGVSLFSDPHHIRADLRLAAAILAMGVVPDETVAKCLKGGWEFAEKGMEQQDADVGSRIYARAMTVNLAAAKLVADRLKAQAPGSTTNFYGPVQFNLGEAVKKAMGEPEYLEYLERRALEEDGNAGAVCANGQQVPVENGQASNGHLPGTNGQH